MAFPRLCGFLLLMMAGSAAVAEIRIPTCAALEKWAAPVPVRPPQDYRPGDSADRQAFAKNKSDILDGLFSQEASTATFGSNFLDWSREEVVRAREAVLACQSKAQSAGRADAAKQLRMASERVNGMQQARAGQQRSPVPMVRAQTASATGYDIVRAADTLGIRPGMTLAQVRDTVASYGGEIDEPERRGPTLHRGFIGGPNPTIFTRSVGVGSKNTFMHPLDGSRSRLFVGLFPRDPTADFRDDANLIVFFVDAQFEFKMMLSEGGTMQTSDFRDAVNKRYGPFANEAALKKVVTAGISCWDAVGMLNKAPTMAAFRSVGGETQYETLPQMVAVARQCGKFDAFQTLESNGQVTHVVVERYDFKLAEEAYRSLVKVVGHEAATEAAAAQQQASKPR